MKKFYIYRNLHTGGFSVKQGGLVVQRPHVFEAGPAEFKVNEAGRQRVIQEKRKNVHAYAVLDVCPVEIAYGAALTMVPKGAREISYNPYGGDYFYFKDTGEKVTKVKKLWGHLGKLWGEEEN